MLKLLLVMIVSAVLARLNGLRVLKKGELRATVNKKK
jgi:hypothetical protein